MSFARSGPNKEYEMSSQKRSFSAWSVLTAMLSIVLFTPVNGLSADSVNVCTSGISIPPFLSAGYEPNLLMMIDNSGSMLDMAYTDVDIDGFVDANNDGVDDTTDRATQCYDESFLTDPDDGTVDLTRTYVGYLERDAWYVWVPSPELAWMSGGAYLNGQIVIEGGIFYQADCGAALNCTSDAVDSIKDDQSVDWTAITGGESWQNASVYPANSFVRSGDILYYSELGGTSNDSDPTDGTNIEGDVGVTDWQVVDYTWRPSTAYVAQDIVTYKGMIFQALGDFTSSSTGLFDDRVGGLATGLLNWQRLDEGYFQEWTAVGDPCPNAPYPDDSIRVTVLDENGAVATDFDPDQSTPSGLFPVSVSCFAARGNFLNWATASKLDIQKKILTGGKFNPGYEVKDSSWEVDNTYNNQTLYAAVIDDTEDDRMIMESRGCGESGFVKQILLDATDNIWLTLRIRGSDDEDWVDSTDDTARIDILGMTIGGFDISQCQAAIDKMIAVGSGFQNDVDSCLTGPDGVSRPALNHALQYCWQDNNTRNLNTIMADCEQQYVTYGYDPADIKPEMDGYNCYGVYDENTEYMSRLGYMGRCWEYTGGAPCYPKPAVPYTAGPPEDGCDADPCEYQYGGAFTDRYKNEDGYNYWCNNLKNDGILCQNDVSFELIYTDVADGSGATCDPTLGTGGWTYNLDGNPSNDPDDADYLYAPGTNEDRPTATGGYTDTQVECAWAGMEAYCADLTIPEVIDPSDQASTTTEYWNLPALLVESGMMTQLAAARPLAVMKGYIKYDLPEEQQDDDVARPDGPRGVLWNVASEIRMGIMAFNDFGSEYECDNFVLSSDRIAAFCPTENRDGSKLLAPMDIPMWIDDPNNTPENTADDVEHWENYNVISEAINSIQATSWTPLAEAMINAIGYFTQNPDLCMNQNLSGMCVDLCVEYDNNGDCLTLADDPIEAYCQDNHILIITEGDSTADIEENVLWGFLSDATNNSASSYLKNYWDASTSLNGEADSLGGDESPLDDDPIDQQTTCDTGLEGSTYFDDMTWWAKHVGPLYATRVLTDLNGEEHEKNTISTHIVTTGSLRTEGTGECSAETLMNSAAYNGGTDLYGGEDPSDLEKNLVEAFTAILGKASAGSAASVISSSRSGEGAIYQAIFWPALSRGVDAEPLNWVGDVHAFFINSAGELLNDYDHNNQMDESVDQVIKTSYDADTSKTYICDEGDWTAEDGCDPSAREDIREYQYYLWSVEEQLEEITSSNISVNRSVTMPLSATYDYEGTWDFTDKKRYIFTWNDLDNDGVVDYSNDEVLEFTENAAVDWTNPVVTSVAGSRQSVLADFGFTDATGPYSSAYFGNFINWVRGADTLYETAFDPNIPSTDINGTGVQDYVYRCRRFPECDYTDEANNPEWRMGDVIHSTPSLVSRPAEAYHYIYRDRSYLEFAKYYQYRRHVIYFGGNDGMLHAINGGYYYEQYDTFYECNRDQFSTPLSSPPVCDGANSYAELGDELWAYIPYNLQPHLKELSNPVYSHRYYVDQRPRIADVQIFEEEPGCLDSEPDGVMDDPDSCIHLNGWGTILVGAMRFGGAPVIAADPSAHDRIFSSAYFILDITDPERPPKLLAEMTNRQLDALTGNEFGEDCSDSNNEVFEANYATMGYTITSPTFVVMRDCNVWNTSVTPNICTDFDTTWYFVTGNGPSSIDGTNSLQGRIGVFPLEKLTDGSATRFSFNDSLPTSGDPNGIFLLDDWDYDPDPAVHDNESFVADLITVDFDFTQEALPGEGALYKSDAVYFGTTDGTGFANPPHVNGDDYWPTGGRMFRLVTKKFGVTSPSTADIQRETTPDEWELKLLIDAHAPISSAASLGYDDENFWIYFSTGRFFNDKDKTDGNDSSDNIQRSFGIKEPYLISGLACDDDDYGNLKFSWAEVDWWNESTVAVQPLVPGPIGTPGQRGLLRTDYYWVPDYFEHAWAKMPFFLCDPDDGACSVPAGISDIYTVTTSDSNTYIYYSWNDLLEYIAGEDCNSGLDGWYREFQDDRERSIGQAALLGGLVVFTTYQPSADVCSAEGNSFLYGVHYQTGTAWYENIFGHRDESILIKDTEGTETEGKIVSDRISLGEGMTTTPSMHVGTGGDHEATAFVQSSTGDIIAIKQENLPMKGAKSGKMGWSDMCE